MMTCHFPLSTLVRTLPLLAVSLNAAAQITADSTAPKNQQPVILKQGNTPFINIQSPNTAGLSHNRYTQFDIDNKGVILNNHRNSNPHLAKGTAGTILNEVRSNKASKIEGAITVQGTKADVIVANPSGISINGGAVKNAKNVVLTSGPIEQKNGKINNIQVQQGKITVGAKGLDSRGADYTQIIAKAVEIQGKLQAKQLLVSSGSQNANYQTDNIRALTPKNTKSLPTVGIDTAKLGGMYADHIVLITNDKGAGVHNSGTMSGHTILLDSAGKIENKGALQANDKLVMRTNNTGANGDILLRPNSTISGSADMRLNAGGQIYIDRATISQTKSNQDKPPKLALVGHSVTMNAGKINTPNALSITTTSGSLKLNANTVNSQGALSNVLKEQQNKINAVENEKDTLNSLIAILNRNGDIQTPQFSEINAGDITFNLAGGLDIQGANLRSNKDITINSYGSTNGKTISIQGKHLLAESGSGDDYSYASIYQPTMLKTKNNISINALQPSGNNQLSIKGSLLNAENGMVNISGYGDVALDYAKDEYYRYHKYSYKHGSKLRRKTTTVINEQQHSYAVPTVISAKNGISITAGEHLTLFASELNAPKNKINLTAGKGLSLYAVDEQHKTRTENHTSKRFLGIKTGSSHHEREQILNEPLPVKLVAQSASLKSGWDTLLQGTQFNTLSGAKIEAGVGEKARGDATILLQGIKSTVQIEESKRKTSIAWQAFQHKGLIDEQLTLPTFTGGKPIFNASGGIIVDMPKGKLRNELETLLKKPEYAYLKNLKLNDQVQWKAISLAYQSWDYKQQGLTAAGAAVIALAMAAVTSGAGVTTLGLASTSAYAPIANTAFTTLTTQATTSLVNNRGNLNQTFKELGSTQQVKQFATAVISAGIADKLVNVAGVNNPEHYLDTFSKNLIEAGSTAAVQAGINGGKFTKALEDAVYNALLDTVHAKLAKNIKGIKNQADANKWYREAAHKIAHAVAGCGVAAGKGGKCTDGALGAALGETVGEFLLNGRDPAFLSDKEKKDLTNKSKLIIGSVTAITGGNVDIAAQSAETAIKNNLLWLPVLAVSTGAYTYIIGDNDLGNGLTIIADGNDPISKSLSYTSDIAIGFAMDKAPEATKAVLQGLNQVASKIEGFVTYIDTKTGKRVSSYWHNIDEQTRKQIIGTTKIVSVIVPASKVGALNNAAKSVKGVKTTQLSQVATKIDSSNMKQLIAQRQSGIATRHLVLDINGKRFTPIAELSKGASVYKGVSEAQVKQLFKELAGVRNLPKPRDIPGTVSIDGKQGIIYILNTNDGKNIVLRNFSTSVGKTNAKWTIEISRLPNSKVKTIEMKFQ